MVVCALSGYAQMYVVGGGDSTAELPRGDVAQE